MHRNTKIMLIIVGFVAVLMLAYLVGRRSNERLAVTAPPTITPNATVTASGSPTATPTPGVPRCHTADLRLALSEGNGAAGTIYVTIDLINKSAMTCTLYGYPGVSLLDSSGAQLGQPAVRSRSILPALIRLEPGKASHANLAFSNSGNYPTGTCSAKSDSIRIFVPDETIPIISAFTQENCPGFSVTALAAAAQ